MDPDDVDPVVVLRARADEAATAAWCELIRSALVDGPGAIISCDVERLSGSAADVINALARMQLTALGCGGRIRLRRAGPALLALLELAGLTEVLGHGEPEQGEESRI